MNFWPPQRHNMSTQDHQVLCSGHRPVPRAVMFLLTICFFLTSFNIKLSVEQQLIIRPNDHAVDKITKHYSGIKKTERQDDLNRLPRESVHRVAFITFSYVKHNDTHKLFNFLLPAVDTWAAPSSNENIRDMPSLYVIFSEVSREPFEDICLHGHGNLSVLQRELCQRLHPIYVDCPETRAGEGPCCRQQKGLVSIIQSDYPLYDWYAFFDDDVYLRKEYVTALLAELQPSNFPMAAVPYSQVARPLGWQKSRCGIGHEEFAYPW